MWLFPGEELILSEGKDYEITAHIMPEFGKVYLLTCDGACDRDIRPLACRICPLAPLYTSEEIKVRLDIRGMPICPLVNQSMSSLSLDFIKSAKLALNQLAKNPEQRRFIKALSSRIDKFKDPLSKL